MRDALTLLFLIASYNFLLWYITWTGLLPIPLFPTDPHHVVLVLSYNSVLYVSWLFGERHRTVQWIGYLLVIQIIALSVYFEDLRIIVKDLSPVAFTIALVVLFESPTEKRIKSVEREREDLLREIDRVRRERERVEVHLRMLRSEIEELEKEREKGSKELEERLAQLQRELEEYKEKESRLLETNRKLFQLLEMMREEVEPLGSKEELASLRKERKRLVREVIGLQELLDVYADENEKLKEENARLKKRVEELNLKLGEMELRKENRESGRGKLYRDVLEDILQIKVSERAAEELARLPVQKRRMFLKELLRFSHKEGQEKVEPLTVVPGVYKLRLPGGRIYLKRRNGSWEVVGVLGSEDDKEKDRYIRNVLSKID